MNTPIDKKGLWAACLYKLPGVYETLVVVVVIVLTSILLSQNLIQHQGKLYTIRDYQYQWQRVLLWAEPLLAHVVDPAMPDTLP